jgi:Spy/CpxP family protein refolding chaperone
LFLGLTVLGLLWSSGAGFARQASATGPKPSVTASGGGQTGAGAVQGRSNTPPPPGAGRGGGPRDWKWWQDDAIKKELALTDLQIRKIDRIFESRTKESEGFSTELSKRQQEIDKMLRERLVDESTLAVQIMQMQVFSSELYKSRVIMNYSMSRVLNADQYQKLEAIVERHWQELQKQRGRGGVPRPR